MHLVKFYLSNGKVGVGWLDGEDIRPLKTSEQYPTLNDILEADDPRGLARFLVDEEAPIVPFHTASLLPPIDFQEVWAAGVTYKRSRVARMEESKGAAQFYDKVYVAPRPELFFKASPHRVVGPHQPVRIRSDASWNVPEPELALVLNSRLELVGFTIGNDMSSRDIEGENPLYLPQAKVYDGCCALGPSIFVDNMLPDGTQAGISLSITRNKAPVFSGQTKVSQLARTFDDLVGYLGRDNSFPKGVFLLTGTGIVPPDDFTLEAGDMVEIEIDGLGVLRNPVVRGG